MFAVGPFIVKLDEEKQKEIIDLAARRLFTAEPDHRMDETSSAVSLGDFVSVMKAVESLSGKK